MILALAAPAAPLHAQAMSRFSPRVPDGGTGTPSGPGLALYAGPAHGYDGEMGTAFSAQLELGRVGPARGLVGIVAGKVVGSAELGLLVQPDPEARMSPYVAASWFIHDFDDGGTGIAFHVGASVAQTRELALRFEGRAYMAKQTALAGLIGIAFR